MDNEFSGIGFASKSLNSTSNLTSSLTTETLDTSKVIALEETGSEESTSEENRELNPLVAFVDQRYRRAKDARRTDESRWLLAYSNYRGVYGTDVAFLSTEKSRAFVKITKTKVVAAHAQITDILFSTNKFPIGVESSLIPEGIEESIHFDPKSAEEQGKKMGAPSPQTSSTVARPDILASIGTLRNPLEPVKEMLKSGPGLTPTSYTYEPAKTAAREMEKLIHDQLLETHADRHIRSFVFDMCLFGTGVFKGPFALDKEYPKWDTTGKYTPLISTIAESSHVSVWDAYPDPDARSMADAEYFIQRHRLSRTELRNLKKRPYFRKDSIELAINDGAHYVEEYWEAALKDSATVGNIDRFEVFEYWGVLDAEIAEEVSFDIPKEFKDFDQIQVNVWICNNQILRLVLNPFTPNRIPFHACPYELNPYSFFGIGIAENMEDTQLLMNGFMRLAVDNAVLSSNIILEVDETTLVPGQNMELHPGKIFRRQGGAPGQAIFATKFPNVTNECLMMFDKARQLSDEATGMPSYSHGVSGVMGTGRTAAGMSMLMGAAKENIKAVVRNIDDYMLVPLGKAYFAFNMQFNFDKKFLGDVAVVARGTESLMRNEVRSQKLLQFLQIASNPMDAPYVKRDYILRELAQSLDLEPDKVVNDPREAAIQAEVIAKMQKVMGIPQQGMNNPAGVPSAEDPTGTGGGNIAPGAAPGPQEQGFTGAGGGMNSPPPAQPPQAQAA